MEASVRSMTEGTIPDTTIHEPSMTGSEVDMLLFALDRSRGQFASKCGRLDATCLSKPHTSAARTSAARPTVWWERTRRRHDDAHGGTDPR
jgi:hypothetical protein